MMDEALPPADQRFGLPFKVLAVLIAVLLCAWWSIAWTRGAEGFSSLWIAGGVVCGVLLGSPRREWPWLTAAMFVGSFAINFLHGSPASVGIGLSLANTLEPWMVAYLVARRISDVSRLAAIGDSVAVATVATGVVCAASAFIATLVRMRGISTDASFAGLFGTWYASHAVGMAIFATLTICARVEGRLLLGAPGRRIEFLLTLGLVACVVWLVFAQTRYSLTYLVFPPLLLCIFRHRFSGFVFGSGIIAIIATTATAAGHGPFLVGAADSDTFATLMLQGFIASICLVAFPMAAALTGRKVLASRVRRSERDYRLLADYSRDLIVRVATDGTRLYTSPSAATVLGWAAADLRCSRWECVHPDDRAAFEDPMKALFSDGGERTFTVRLRHVEGHYLWIEFNACAVSDGDGHGTREVILGGRDVSRRVEAERKLDRQARHDALTGLANRLHFGERLALAVARQARSGNRMAVLFMDVDHFKRINDSLGHAVGDAVLREFAVRLRGSVREVDFPARLGGDEFVVLVEDLALPDAPQRIAEKLLESLRAEMLCDGHRLKVTTSIGIGVGTAAQDDGCGDSILQLADAALYQAKAAGRNAWRLASQAERVEEGKAPDGDGLSCP